ncbi:MAG: hypothetical protein H7328_11590 [Bdellovibrio sp.]|nr:hypothetical protein [Bdellovibrio sp.]
MKKIFFSFLFFLSAKVFAVDRAKDMGRIDMMPIQVQLRYEDSVEQTRQLQSYKGLFGVPLIELNLAYQYKDYRFSFGRSYQNEKTGNQTLKIEKSTTEYLLGAGYRVFQKSSVDEALSIELFANAFYGSVQAEVVTNFFGSSSLKSDPDQVFAVGTSVVGRYQILVVEADFKYLYSVNMNPQYVPVFAVRIGASFYF